MNRCLLSTKERLAEYWSDTLTELSEDILRDDITAPDAAEIIIEQLEAWIQHFKEQHDASVALREALRERVC